VPGGVVVAPGVLRSTGAGSESGSKQPHSKGVGTPPAGWEGKRRLVCLKWCCFF